MSKPKKKPEPAEPPALAAEVERTKNRPAFVRAPSPGEVEFIGPPTGGTYKQGANCEGCFEFFEALVCVVELRELARARYCPACVAKHEEEERAKRIGPTRADRWKKLCPPGYLNTDLDRLVREGKLAAKFGPDKQPKTGAEVVAEVMARGYSERGLVLTGVPRSGKTRLMLKHLESLYLQGHGVAYVYAPDFSDELAALWGDSPTKANAFVKRFFEVPCWFLDDLGKGKLSERAQSTILRVVEHRMGALLPTFITANASGDDLIRKMSDPETGEVTDFAVPLIERIRETCDPYRF